MSEQAPTEAPGQGRAQVPDRPGRYQRSTSGLVGALLVLLLIIGAFLLLNLFTRDNSGVPTPTVDYRAALSQARQDPRLLAPVPATMPLGWRATSVTYLPGSVPQWHLGILARGQYVGIEEQRVSVGDLVASSVQDAQPGPTVRLGGALAGTWRSWSGANGDYALTRELGQDTVLVVGTIGPAQVRHLVTHLAVNPQAKTG